MRVGIIGATGLIGQSYVALLENHPWFEIAYRGSSSHSEGDLSACELIFSALPSNKALEIEPELAKQGFPVISSAAAHRKEPHVPLIIPEINAHHLESIRHAKGFIVAKPNCSIQSFLLPLAPLHTRFKIKSLSVTTLQAVSGAGKDATFHDHVIPYIEGEEEKNESEPHKILDSNFPITAHCNRVPVLHGHMACVSVSFEQKPSEEEIRALWGKPTTLDLPSAPKYPVIYSDKTKLDEMSVSVSRLRPCSIFDWRFVALSHNAIRGGAGGGLLIAELLLKEGYIG